MLEALGSAKQAQGQNMHSPTLAPRTPRTSGILQNQDSTDTPFMSKTCESGIHATSQNLVPFRSPAAAAAATAAAAALAAISASFHSRPAARLRSELTPRTTRARAVSAGFTSFVHVDTRNLLASTPQGSGAEEQEAGSESSSPRFGPASPHSDDSHTSAGQILADSSVSPSPRPVLATPSRARQLAEILSAERSSADRIQEQRGAAGGGERDAPRVTITVTETPRNPVDLRRHQVTLRDLPPALELTGDGLGGEGTRMRTDRISSPSSLPYTCSVVADAMSAPYSKQAQLAGASARVRDEHKWLIIGGEQGRSAMPDKARPGLAPPGHEAQDSREKKRRQMAKVHAFLAATHAADRERSRSLQADAASQKDASASPSTAVTPSGVANPAPVGGQDGAAVPLCGVGMVLEHADASSAGCCVVSVKLPN